MKRSIKPSQIYKHFKGKYYVVLDIANDADSNNREDPDKIVIYQALYGDHLKWVRKLDEFASEVDHQKYPNITQKYRFEEAEISQQI